METMGDYLVQEASRCASFSGPLDSRRFEALRPWRRGEPRLQTLRAPGPGRRIAELPFRIGAARLRPSASNRSGRNAEQQAQAAISTEDVGTTLEARRNKKG